MFDEPESLGMSGALKMIEAPRGETFFYRDEHKRIITAETISEFYLHQVKGPLVYCVTDKAGVVRYIGKWESESSLYSRWFRRNHLHHQKSSRNIFIRELDDYRAPLTLWVVSASKLKKIINEEDIKSISNKELVKNIEALWISRWKKQLWNKKCPSFPSSFTDYEFWCGEKSL